MSDDAVAPVVAAMLLLAVLVTFFSVWNAVYLPALKQQAEMEQDQMIKAAFGRFSSAIETAIAQKGDLTLSEPLPLGGGAVIFSPVMSAGTIRVNEEPKQLYTVTVTESGIDHEYSGRLVNFSYQPVNDFWLDQGYVWHYGYVNVTRGVSQAGADGAALSTPLMYPAMDDVKHSAILRTFAGTLISIESRPWYNSSSNCSHITVSPVSFHKEPGAAYSSGNGIGVFGLSANVNETSYGVPETTSPDLLIIRVSRTVPEPTSTGLYIECNRTFAQLAKRYPHNIAHTFTTTIHYNETSIAPVAGSLPFDVTVRNIVVNISAR